jgi:membrane-associated phospholipid phosphatase
VGLPLSAIRAASVTRPQVTARARVSARAVTFWALLALYVALTVCVLVPSPVLDFDKYLAGLHLKSTYPGWRLWINHYVIFGQRGPATLAFLPVFIWVAWRTRSKRPLVMLGTALVLLNVSVGVVKYAVGRLGPMHAADTDVHDIFAGGNIYPSGHVSNAVVLYGLVAWVVGARWRKVAIVAAAFLSVTVGLGTVYLRTHWFSDVVGGWLAGALVLLSMPTVLPYAQRWTDKALVALRRWYARRRGRPEPGAAVAQYAVVQPNETPVSSSARDHSAAAVPASLDDLDEPTRVG